MNRKSLWIFLLALGLTYVVGCGGSSSHNPPNVVVSFSQLPSGTWLPRLPHRLPRTSSEIPPTMAWRGVACRPALAVRSAPHLRQAGPVPFIRHRLTQAA